MKTRIALLTGIAAGALLSSPAVAQDDPVTVSAEAPAPAPTATNVPENVIIITARRRAEESQTVPLAIATLDGRTITGCAVAIPVSEFVWPGPPVTSDSAGLRWIRAHASAACVTPDSCRRSTMRMPARDASARTSFR